MELLSKDPQIGEQIKSFPLIKALMVSHMKHNNK